MRSKHGSRVSVRVSPNKSFNVFLLQTVFKHAEQDIISGDEDALNITGRPTCYTTS